jgi:hypothetical protein
VICFPCTAPDAANTGDRPWTRRALTRRVSFFYCNPRLLCPQRYWTHYRLQFSAPGRRCPAHDLDERPRQPERPPQPLGPRWTRERDERSTPRPFFQQTPQTHTESLRDLLPPSKAMRKKIPRRYVTAAPPLRRPRLRCTTVTPGTSPHAISTRPGPAPPARPVMPVAALRLWPLSLA